MLRSRQILIVLLALFTFAAPALADEGMWPLYELEKLDFDQLASRGLALTPAELYAPGAGGLSDAIVSLSGGTASFVSAEGLLLTNHHVAYGAIQKMSTLEEHYLQQGFSAARRADELPALGDRAYIDLGSEDVTEHVLGRLDDAMTDRERYGALETVIKELVRDAEAAGDVKARVARMHGGTQFILYRRFEIKDLRIVHVPPESVGKYGGDIDNWMWPRHTGDYSFLRAYVAPDGSSAEFAEENVPYRPGHVLPISRQGVAEGDLTFIIGYPGRTSRYASAALIEEMQTHMYPEMIARLTEVLEMLSAAAAANPEYELRLADRMASLNNWLKNSQGMLDGFLGANLLAEKREQERALREYLKETPALQVRFGDVLDEMAALVAERGLTRKKDSALRTLSMGSQFYGMASRIQRFARERAKPDLERDRGFQQRDEERARQRMDLAQINLLPEVDRMMLRYALLRILELPSDQRVAAVDSIFAGQEGAALEVALEAWLDEAFATTRLGDREMRMGMFGGAGRGKSAEGMPPGVPGAAMAAMQSDPFFALAGALEPEMETMRERRKRLSGAQARLEPRLIAAYAAWKEGQLYPDANSTQRFNVGEVGGFGPAEDPRWDYLTTLGGMRAKGTGEDPFLVPAELQGDTGAASAYRDARCGDVPVCFLSSNDGTGGNSGSPVLNGRGEIVGLLFDGNYESIAADYLYEASLVRAINVDLRYVLHLVDEVYRLEDLVAELELR